MTRLVIFAKAPQAGSVKTRLIPALGAQGAAALAHLMLSHTLAQALAVSTQAVELCMSPAPSSPAWQGVALPQAVERSEQGKGDLGARMNLAMERALALQQGPVLLMGTDCPALSAAHIAEAGRQLEQHDAVLLPAADGGYVLIGLRAPCPDLFTGMAWSTPVVAAETLRRMAALGLRVWQGPLLHDIDEPTDLAHLPAKFTSPSFIEKIGL
ncbi:MAG: TIGR04282 family arsenosugar biosynthesis glycosyltransferase [Polaromonas sp.]